MPKAAKYALLWSAASDNYELHEQGHSARLLASDDNPAWFVWLETHSGFAFAGRAGRVSLLKEARKGGAGYWYAYRRHGKRTLKHYLGRSADLTIARLEAAAAALIYANELVSPPVDDPVVPQPHPHATRARSDADAARATSQMLSTAPLLTPKLQLPRLPAGLVVRARLFAQLDAGLARKLTLLAAPAGFGKTTLVASWLASRSSEFKVLSSELSAPESTQNFKLNTQNFQVAWVALDDGDNDPMRFWRYVITACQSFEAQLGHAALALLATTLQPPFNPLSHEMLLSPFLNDLARQTRHGILVLEDYHLITEPQIHEAVSFFLDHLPATLHVVILTRNVPPLPLARMRAGGDLGELHAVDLRFSIKEITRFLHQTLATSLAPEAITQIDTQLEGWAAGLRLLALALQGRDSPQDIARVLATFAGGHRPVLDYFVAEVLSAQPPHIQDFLLRTSMLDRLTGALCDAVLDDRPPTKDEERTTTIASSFVVRPSSFVLEELARTNLFLEPLDGAGQWYRYHALFADAMRYEARVRLGDTMLRRVSSTASIWYEQRGMLAEAVQAALQAQEPARAAALIEQIVENPQFRYANQLFSEATEWHTLRRWLEQLPDPVLRQHPLLCLNYAIALLLVLMAGRSHGPTVALVETSLQMAEEGFRATNNTAKLGEVFAFRSIIIKQRGEIDASVAWARQALALLPAEEMAWRGASLSSIGTGEHFAGRLDVARKLFIEARAISEAIENWGFTRAIIGMLSGVYVEQGELHQAAAHMRQTLAEAREQGDHDDVAHAQISLMQLSYEWNALDAAEQQAREAFEIGEHLADDEFKAQATLMLAQIEHARGQTAAAQQRVASLLDQLQSLRALRLRWYERAARCVQVRFQLAAGDLAAVQRWADTRAHADTAISCLQLAREEQLVARLLFAQGQADQALALLTRLLATAQRAGHTRFALETQVLLVLAHSARKQLPEARQMLQAALARAAGEGYVRLFLDEGPALATVLRASLPAIREPALVAYLQTLIHAFAAEHLARDAQPGDPARALTLAEPLSPQEQRVLCLLVAGRSNPEIAAQLVVSVNTVKAHLKNIYRKLSVRNRMQAARQVESSKQ
jgi:LuxR family maltose regulon positive regulatory protein